MSSPITPPTQTAFKESRFELRRKTGMSTSPFSGVQQVYEHPYALWAGVYTLPPLSKAQASAWRAFFIKLKGKSGTFLIGDPDAMEPNGSVSGSVVLTSNASVGDESINVDTAINNGTDVFKAGDMIQLGSGADARLYMVTDDADTNASGGCTLNVMPAIKLAKSSGESVVYTNPAGVFRLESDITGWDVDSMGVHGISFACQEAL